VRCVYFSAHEKLVRQDEQVKQYPSHQTHSATLPLSAPNLL